MPGTGHSEPARLAYRPEIDGLRAAAVLLVIVYHGDFGFFTGGFVGVDVFFVISGFLITGILLGDLDSGRFSLKTFYERRCRRILPPLLVMCLLVFAAGWFILMPVDFRSFGSSLVAAGSFWANHYFFRQAGYFDTASFTKPLLHTWSLAVEEQFYFVLPLLLWLLFARFRRWMPHVLICLFTLSLACSQVFLSHTPWGKEAESAYYLLPSRFWEMLAGSLLALFARGRALPLSLDRRRAALCWLGMGMIFVTALAYSSATAFPGIAALPPVLGAALLILAAGGGAGPGRVSLPVRMLSCPAMVFIGKMSYSLYLWHWPLFALARYHADAPLPPAVKIGLAAASFVMAWLSWKFVENPVRHRVVLKTRGSVFAASVGCIVLLAALGTVLRRTNGFPERLPEHARPFAHSVSDRYNSPPWDTYTHSAIRNGVEYDFQAWDVNPGPGRPQSFMIIGNSHSRMWLEAVDALAVEYGLSGVVVDPSSYRETALLSLDGAGPGGWNTDDYLLSMMDMAREKGVRHVLLLLRTSPSTGLPVLAEAPAPPNDWSRRFAAGLLKTAEAYADRGMALWFAENVPEYMTDMPNTLTRHAVRGGEARELGYSAEYYRNRHSPLTALYPELEAAGVKILRMEPVFFPGGRCAPGDAGGAYYLDTNHLTRYGARAHKGALAPFFEVAGTSNF